LRDQSPYLVAAVLLSSVASWIAVRRGLIPLRAAAEGATRIDMNSLNQRLPDRDVPSEVMPLVGAVNDALIRLDAGSGRLRRFMANAAHELRTPLAILNARLSAPEEPTFKKDLKRDVRRARHIVEQLLATTRLGERSAEIIQGVDLAAAVKTVATDAAILAIKNRRRLEFDAPPAPVFVKANGPALESVVANLIDNALRAEPEGGTIIVRVIQDATVEVIDHGEGVAGDDREMIFEPFWRKSEATPGSGLGLAIAKELMETLGGRIWIEDTLGGGATFKLSFSRTGFI
jgi:two-component system, OmpR family, sensor kinase